jgi:DNA-binding transcriptional regulator YhcF (GntR family)
MQGWISLHRKIIDNPIMAKPNYLAVWIYLLTYANHKEKIIIWNNKKTIVKRGQFVGSIKQIAEHYKLSLGTVSYILEYLENDGMIIKKSNKKFTLFEILNFDRYQKSEPLESSKSLDSKGLDEGLKNRVENKLKSNRNQIETTNNDNNDNTKRYVQNEFEQATIFKLEEVKSKEELLKIEFNKFWKYYDLKINEKDCFVKWKKLSTATKDKIRKHLPEYIKSTNTDGTYPSRKNPLTYLRKESWNDEIISSTKAEDNQKIISLTNRVGVQ